MDQIVELVEHLAVKEGFNPTLIPEIGIYKTSSAQKRMPLLYQQGVILCVQGEKNVYLEDKVYTYNKDNYLVVTVPLPLECEVSLKNAQPLLAVVMDINIQRLNQIIHLMGQSVDFKKLTGCKKEAGLYTSPVNSDFSEIIYRLLKTLQSPEDTRVLGEGIYQELLYHLLKESKAAPLYALTLKNTPLSKIELALREIHQNFARSVQVDELAKLVSMSSSSFHQAFKEVTATSPIQYIKKVRLDKARAFLLQSMRVNEVARKVGYESVSQFSREFKRYYGMSPKHFSQG